MLSYFGMNGYGVYVWPAYCITFLVFGINCLYALLEKNKIKKIIKLFHSAPKIT